MPTPVTINFSVPWNVAVTLLAGELTPSQVSDEWLTANADALLLFAVRRREAEPRDIAEAGRGGEFRRDRHVLRPL